MNGSIARYLVSTICVVLVACGGAPLRTSHAPAVAVNDTTLGPNDVFDVRVYGEQELSSQYRVAQDGSIDFPFIGRTQVAGLEPTQIADLISQKLQDGQFFHAPQVSLQVREYNSKHVAVVGAVAHPGTFPLTSGLTVVQAISLSGGVTAIANADSTVVTRRVNGELRRYRVPVDAVTQGGADDFVLSSGDIIYVPERILF